MLPFGWQPQPPHAGEPKLPLAQHGPSSFLLRRLSPWPGGLEEAEHPRAAARWLPAKGALVFGANTAGPVAPAVGTVGAVPGQQRVPREQRRLKRNISDLILLFHHAHPHRGRNDPSPVDPDAALGKAFGGCASGGCGSSRSAEAAP